jgi:F-type H+-transporting ATPase subunit epsilon
MPHTPFPVEVLTPEGEVFNGEVEQISTRTTAGSIGILANHEPLLATLEPTELRLYRSDSDILRYDTTDGSLHVLILVRDAKPVSGS